MLKKIRTKKHGFTLIELTIAMSFIAVLLIVVVMVTINILNMYRKGTTIQDVNTTGRAIIDDMSRTLQSSTQATSASLGNGSGRLCTGSYAYIWNSPSDATPLSKYSPDSTTDGNQEIMLIKISADGSGLCGTSGSVFTKVELGTKADLKPNVLIQPGDNLAIYGLRLFKITDPTSSQTIYTVSFILGTTTGINVDTNLSCTPPTGVGSDFSYCAINRFDFTVRTLT
ncbi:prepilin-type N-terminal cleavage/methylation domain-containing protein [Candidatus Saccharibacteria bacterium]|nr:prepilin-type N-terminal cleavage/methylation domain-containing protein [Candidatus Saccharibacteria bacterium]